MSSSQSTSLSTPIVSIRWSSVDRQAISDQLLLDSAKLESERLREQEVHDRIHSTEADFWGD